MRANVLIIPDKFKGTLSATEAAAAIAAGWHRARPNDALDLLPMSDGGDGFGELLSAHLRAEPRQVRSVDAAHRPLEATWWWIPSRSMAIIESAKIIGLSMLPARRFHPFELDTSGLGLVLAGAAQQGASRCLVGIGGSATNDGGFGMARALGWRFLDRRGGEICQWTELTRLTRIRPPRKRKWFRKISVAVDVSNPLLGPGGASRVYGPQKGLRPSDFRLAEAALRRLASVWRSQSGEDVASLPGSGAAGGLGFGLRAFLGAVLEPGFQLFGRHAQLASHIQSARLILTGEGSLDRSTVMGKGVGEIAALARREGIPCFGLGGVIADRAELRERFSDVRSLCPEMAPEAEAKRRPAFWLRRLSEKLAREHSQFGSES